MYTQTLKRVVSELPVIAVVTVAAFLCVGIARYALVGHVRDLSVKRSELRLYRSALTGQGSYDAIKTDIRSDNKRLLDKLNRLSSGMGDPQDLSALLSILIDRADSAGVAFVRIQPQGETHSADITNYPVLLEFSTGFGPLGTLIASLESLPQLVRVDRLAVTALASGKLEVRLLCTCFLSAPEKRS